VIECHCTSIAATTSNSPPPAAPARGEPMGVAGRDWRFGALHPFNDGSNDGSSIGEDFGL
jgi:hypothetical protein